MVSNAKGMVKYLDNFFQLVLKPAIILLFKFYYSRLPRLRPQRVNNKLLLLSATNIAKQIRDKKIKCEYVIQSYIERINEIQPLINCVVDEKFDEALKEAKELDRLIESDTLSDDLKNAPFLGVPFTCKEFTSVKGSSLALGSVARKGKKALEDAEVVKLMRQAGAIPLCITITSELGLWIESSNKVYGQSKNPYDSRRMVGGSSGGEGGLIASCGSVIGIGNDLGGSIRIPAALNGIFGHKTTNGLTNNKGNFPNLKDWMVVSGPMCRYAEDLEPFLEVLVGENVNKLIPYDKNFDFKNVNFFYIENINAPFASKVTREVHLAHLSLIKFIEERFETKVKILSPSEYLPNTLEIFFTSLMEGLTRPILQLISTDQYEIENQLNDSIKYQNPFLELAKSLFGKSEHTLPTIYQSISELLPIVKNKNEREMYKKQLVEICQRFDSLLGQNGILIFPSFTSTAPYHNQALWTNPIDHAHYFGIYNCIGLPSTQVPLGLSSEDLLPIGVQLITNKYCDRLTILLAKYLEKEYAGWIEP